MYKRRFFHPHMEYNKSQLEVANQRLPVPPEKPGQFSSSNWPWKATDSFFWMQGILT